MTAALGNTAQGTPFATGVDAFVYPQFIGYALRAPTNQDVYNPGTRWQDNSVNPFVIYETTGAGVWYHTTNTSIVNSVSGTANQVTASPTTGSVILSIPSTFIAPGTIAYTTTITAGTGITATTGDIVTSAGNINSSALIHSATGVIITTNGLTLSQTGAGITVVPLAASGASPGPVTCNAKTGAVTFTSPSIAAGASLTLTMSNSNVKSGSKLIYSMVGATAGAALSMESLTSSSSSVAFVVTNGTGATTQTDDITITFFVLN